MLHLLIISVMTFPSVAPQVALTCNYQSSCNNQTCANEGDLVQCTCVNGVGNIATTVWSGTAFMCPSPLSAVNNRITLAPDTFGQSLEMCGSNIRVRGIDVTGDNYTSLLNVTTTTDLHMRTVECSVGVQSLRSKTLRIGGKVDYQTGMAHSHPVRYLCWFGIPIDVAHKDS